MGNQFCYRQLRGTFNVTSNGVGFLKVATVLSHGNCTHGNFPAAGLFANINFVVPSGWPLSGRKSGGTQTPGSTTLTGVFVNNGRDSLHPPTGTVGYLTMTPNDGT